MINGILAHGAAQEIFDRHLHYWSMQGKIFIASPVNDPVKSHHDQLAIGAAGHHTRFSILRFRALLATMLAARPPLSQACIIHEYDSLCLTEDPVICTKGPAIFGNPFINSDPQFIAPRYLNPPWVISWDAARMILDYSDRHPWLMEGGFHDRWISAIAHMANIPMLPFNPGGFSLATITSEYLPDASAAVASGARMIHGIKDKETLDQLVSCL